ncbi:L-dopachrome tautomerase-related protein [Pedobacter lithocola]|uniref:L-dopachrome tautomerase-related protein n=1 Tax=Pedobacter lithocola TaxID=1908239 RepID=A0ABV8P6I6_9SPHI
MRIDNKNGYAYLTSSSNGGIIILNTTTGDSRFVLGKSSSVKSDPNYKFSPLGKELVKGDGSILKVNSDGIALTPDLYYLYYKPLTDDKLYRIKTELLRNFSIADVDLDKYVEKLGAFITTDGMIFDKHGTLYLGDLEKNSIVKITPDLKMQTLVQDDQRLRWPDSYSISSDGYLYITCSQIQFMPWFHQNQNKTTYPYQIFRLKI